MAQTLFYAQEYKPSLAQLDRNPQWVNRQLFEIKAKRGKNSMCAVVLDDHFRFGADADAGQLVSIARKLEQYIDRMEPADGADHL